MSIDKSQGQTLSVLVLHLEEGCFAYRQLYVGCSRVESLNNFFIYAPSEKTKNLVYTEVIT